MHPIRVKPPTGAGGTDSVTNVGRFVLAAVVVVAASAGSSLVAAAASSLTDWVRRVVAVALAAVVVAEALTGFDVSLGISLLVVVAAGFVASVFAHIVRDLRTITWLALAAAAADIVSFLFGPTRFLLEAGPDLGGYARYLAVGYETVDGLVLVVGFGDLVFVAVFALALRRLGAGIPGAFVAPTSGLLVALAVGLAVGGTVGIPLAAATTLVYAHLRERIRLRPRDDRRDADDVRP